MAENLEKLIKVLKLTDESEYTVKYQVGYWQDANSRGEWIFETGQYAYVSVGIHTNDHEGLFLSPVLLNFDSFGNLMRSTQNNDQLLQHKDGC